MPSTCGGQAGGVPPLNPGGGVWGKNQAVSCPFREMVADFVANKIRVTFNPHDVEGVGDEK